MFYILELKKSMDVHPKFFGKHLRQYITDKLIQETEGTSNGKYGYVLAVVQLKSLEAGVIRQDGTGFATFELTYTALVCRPYRGEVVDTVVTSVNKAGFFAEAGPLQIFVSNHLIPEDWEFNAVGDPCYQKLDDNTLNIKEGSEVRLRVMGTQMDQTNIFCIGSIKEDYLGVLSSGA